jgi:hypothetical protein
MSVFNPERAKYRGKNSAVMRSSIFSVTLIAKPPSCGQMRPAMKAPKMACTPMTPVKNEEPRAIISVSTMMPWEGPSVRAFSRLRIQRNTGRTAKVKNSAKATQVRRT